MGYIIWCVFVVIILFVIVIVGYLNFIYILVFFYLYKWMICFMDWLFGEVNNICIDF